ncbi:serine/threonine protein kinase [Geodermatophilus bullaregiensis]|uniref:serine/threonine-protein kinase n=1 Tax=Geodermatophilus bullaregiensis TaxID=1564160 RepID=UPI001EF7D9AF|nr:serine/threonine-protein kinase [Geodermatophilus bullaregiensis]MBM7805129.1 serine/threonine protein kinase [Geodermatophilus bullaregiensis]
MSAETGTGRLVAGRYAVTGVLGRGGMGVVWRATDQVLNRPVALKEVTFPAHLSDEERDALRRRTFREARTAARLVHPNVTTLYDVVEEDGRPWLVMEHVDSRSLQEVVQRHGPLPWTTVARIGLDVLAALEAAHAVGIVHRDVKPANVLVGRDCAAHLTDFGIAVATGDPSITTAGAVIGSPPFMSPERARGEDAGPATDLWSLGATLYTAVEGRLAFQRAEPMATLFAVVSDDPAPTERAGALEPVLRGLLTKDPAARMDVPAARRELRRALSGSGLDTAWTPPDTDESDDSPTAGDGAALGGRVERFDADDLRALASVLGTVARDAREQARYLADKRRERKERRERRQAASAAPSPRTPSSQAPSPQAPSPQAPPVQAPVEQAPPGRAPRRQGHLGRGPHRQAPAPPPVATSPPRSAGPARRRWRFKRRWVVVPVVLAVLAVLAAVAGAVALLASAFGAL